MQMIPAASSNAANSVPKLEVDDDPNLPLWHFHPGVYVLSAVEVNDFLDTRRTRRIYRGRAEVRTGTTDYGLLFFLVADSSNDDFYLIVINN